MSDRQKKGHITRGRPAISDEKRDAMRSEVAKVARRLFQDEGYGQVSIRKMAKEIGCSPMTLYKYYDSKIAILRTLWAEILNDVFDLIEKNKRSDLSPIDHLAALASTYVDYWLTNTDHYRLVFMAEGVSQNEVSLFIDHPEIAQRYQVFSEAIVKAHKEPLSVELLKLKSDALICCLHGIAHNKITISGYGWGASKELISTLMIGIVHPAE